MAVRCILFDADGVLVDSERFSTIYRERFGVSEDEMLPFFGSGFQTCLVGKADLKKLVRPWFARWKWKGTVDEFVDFWLKACESVDARMAETIQNLRNNGIICCLATNQERYRSEYMRRDMGFEELFDHVFTSAEIGHKKPENEFFRHILDYLWSEYAIRPDEILFFDDMLEYVDAAKKAGIDAQLYDGFEGFESKIKPLLKRGKK